MNKEPRLADVLMGERGADKKYLRGAVRGFFGAEKYSKLDFGMVNLTAADFVQLKCCTKSAARILLLQSCNLELKTLSAMVENRFLMVF